jgi:hypothetical protein
MAEAEAQTEEKLWISPAIDHPHEEKLSTKTQTTATGNGKVNSTTRM